MRGLFLLVLLCVAASGACAQDGAVGDKALSGDSFLLRDGRSVRLLDVCAALPEAKTRLSTLVHGAMLSLQDEELDRYRRIKAGVFVENKPLAESLVREGMAYVCPSQKHEGLEALLSVEQQALKERRGFWRVPRDSDAADAQKDVGHYVFFKGTVQKAERHRNQITLFFGEAPNALKLVLTAKFLRPLRKRGLDPFVLEGKEVHVRGWVFDNDGPTITMIEQHQLMR